MLVERNALILIFFARPCPSVCLGALQVPGLTSYVGGLVSSLSTLEAPTAILAATEGIGLAALGLGKEAHIDLLYKSQVSTVFWHCSILLLPLGGLWSYG